MSIYNFILSSTRTIAFTFFCGCISLSLAQGIENSRETTRPKPANLATHFSTLSLPDVVQLTETNKDAFRSAVEISASRKNPKKNISRITYEIFTGAAPSPIISTARFSHLSNGLAFFEHEIPATQNSAAFKESGIDVFGIGTILYSNNRSKKTTTPEKNIAYISLLHGELFSMTSPFMLFTKKPLSETAIVCTPVENITAEFLHPKLTGQATKIKCQNLPSEDETIFWYLEDAARYVLYENWSKGELLSKFRIKEVLYDAEIDAQAY